MTQLEFSNIVFLKATVGHRFKSWRAHQFLVSRREMFSAGSFV